MIFQLNEAPAMKPRAMGKKAKPAPILAIVKTA
jgi:hypothetical protein